jgi:hypothetical protein
MKKLGIYIDQSSANLIELTVDILEKKHVQNKPEHSNEEIAQEADENHIEFKESYLQNYYFKKLSECMLYYNEVLLFGKSNAITKLFDMISYDNRFYKIKIALKQTDEMNRNQQNDFVSDYFLLDSL